VVDHPRECMRAIERARKTRARRYTERAGVRAICRSRATAEIRAPKPSPRRAASAWEPPLAPTPLPTTLPCRYRRRLYVSRRIRSVYLDQDVIAATICPMGIPHREIEGKKREEKKKEKKRNQKPEARESDRRGGHRSFDNANVHYYRDRNVTLTYAHASYQILQQAKRRRGRLARSSSVAGLASRLHRLVCPPKVGQRYCATPGFAATDAVSGNRRGLRSSLLSCLSRLSACRRTIIHSWHSRTYSRVSEPHHYHTGPPCSGGVGEQSLSRLSFPLFSLFLSFRFPSLPPTLSLSLSRSLSLSPLLSLSFYTLPTPDPFNPGLTATVAAWEGRRDNSAALRGLHSRIMQFSDVLMWRRWPHERAHTHRTLSTIPAGHWCPSFLACSCPKLSVYDCPFLRLYGGVFGRRAVLGQGRQPDPGWKGRAK